MKETAADQLRRILHVIPALSDGEEHPFTEVADHVGVDVETLRQDLLSLVDRYDDPGAFVDGVQLYMAPDTVALVSNHFRRPMRLTVAELCALELGLAMLRTERPPDEHRAIDSARDRLRQVIAKLPSDLVADHAYHATLGTVPSAEHLATVRRAIRERRKVALGYRRGDADTAAERIIAPYALAAASGMFYVIAYCDRSAAIRIFRIDRVESASLTVDRFEIPASFSLDEVLANGRVLHTEQPGTVRIRYSPRIARWIVEREGGELATDGSLTREHPLADPQWAVRHVLQYGADAEVLSPDAVREAVRARLHRMSSGA